MTSGEACDRLGVRPQTLYAYVSRGLLVPRKDGRRSQFAASEIEALAQRTARGRRPGRLEIHIDTDVTLIDPSGRLFYRGVNVADIAGKWSYERTAEWLWNEEDRGDGRTWSPEPEVLARCRAVVDAAGPAMSVLDRLLLATTAAAGGQSVATREPVAEGRPGVGEHLSNGTLISTIVSALHPRQRDAPRSIAQTLCGVVAAGSREPRLVGLVDTALVLLADHELAASALAVRVTASTKASPAHALAAGLSAVSGRLHGTASDATEALFRRNEHRSEVTLEPLIAGRQEAYSSQTVGMPGVGHAVYKVDDPRATILMQAVKAALPTAKRRTVQAVIDTVRSRTSSPINVDMALGALVYGVGLAPGAGAAIFAVARMAGWLAQYAEESNYCLRYRPRAVYTGTRPY